MKRAAWAPICLAAACVTRPASTPGSESIRYPLVSETRSSGLRTVFEVGPDFGTAGVVLLVKAGSADDPKGKEGLAHLVEHLVLAAPRGRERTLQNGLDAIGATWNASTHWDRTTFFAFPPAHGFAQNTTRWSA
jgi:zinc protease